MADTTRALAVVRRSDRRRPFTTLLWLLRRLLMGVVVLFAVSVIIFTVTQALPGDVARVILGIHATPQQLADLRSELGLDRPITTQYLQWLGGLLTGNLGTSLQNGEPVSAIVIPRMLNSFSLGLTAMFLIIPISAVVGVASASHRDGLFDKAFLSTSALFLAFPPFILGMLLISFFSTNVLQVLPGVSNIPPGDLPWQHPAALVLPVSTLTLMGVMYLGRLVRASFIDVMDGEYVQMAILKGLKRHRVLYRHALPNAIAASLPAAGLVAAVTLTGVVVIEYVYSYPGLGTETINAVSTRDLPVVQACVLILSTAFYIFNLVADVLGQIGRR